MLELLDVVLDLRQVALESGGDTAESQCHLLHLMVNVVSEEVTVLPMVFESDVLRVALELVGAKIFQIIDFIAFILLDLLILFIEVEFTD